MSTQPLQPLTSPIPDQLRLNPPANLSIEAKTAIRALIPPTDSVIRSLDNRIAQHLQSLRALIQEKEPYVSFNKAHARLLHPIFLVPIEIWAEIFRLMCRDPPTSGREVNKQFDSLHPQNPVMVLDRVCVSWREIMRSTPEMWSRPLLKDIAFKYTPNSTDSCAVLDALSRSLEYSSARPLYITLSFRITSPPSRESVDAVMQRLLEHHRRWTCFKIDISHGHIYLDIPKESVNAATESFLDCVTSGGIAKLPELEDLTLLWPDENRPRLLFPNLTNVLPKLRKIHLYGRCPEPACLPWAQLEDIMLKKVPRHECFPVLPHLSSAVKASIHAVEGPDAHLALNNGPLNPMTYTLPNIRKLALEQWDPAMFAAATMPKLRKLSILYLPISLIVNVAEFIQRSECPIDFFSSEICLQDFDFAGGSLKEPLSTLLHSMAHLQYLHLCNERNRLAYSQTLLELLTENINGDMTYCPSLSTLRLDRSFWNQPLLIATMEMVEIRWNARKIDLVDGKMKVTRGLRCVGNYSKEDPEGDRTNSSSSLSDANASALSKLMELERDGLKIRALVPVSLDTMY